MAMRIERDPLDAQERREDEAFVGAKQDAVPDYRRVSFKSGKEWDCMVCPRRQGQLLRRAAEVERNQQPFAARSTFIGEDVTVGVKERNVADRERAMRATERE
jgi:hypothetical protein